MKNRKKFNSFHDLPFAIVESKCNFLQLALASIVRSI
jgi:hypothetical protein